MRSNLDLLGVMVIAFIVALGRGGIRDLLIGATPAKAVADSMHFWRGTAPTRSPEKNLNDVYAISGFYRRLF
jgi:hypothetical protein